MLNKRTLIKDTPKGKTVTIFGWIDSIRDHGKITFIDIRDKTGIVQCVGKNLGTISVESVVSVQGKVAKRPVNLRNPNL